jgi:predicted RNA-binding Zn ribbon-like protein
VVFAHDTQMALLGTAALINTGLDEVGAPVERLTDVAALDAFCHEWQWSGRRDRTFAELEAVRGLRPRLSQLWNADEDHTVEIVNTLLREHKALPQLLKHGAWGYHLHASDQEAPLADRMAVEAAMAMIDVVRMGELGRLRVCASDTCEWVFVDLSKNRSRRFCEGGCGNRAHVAAYRARQRT